MKFTLSWLKEHLETAEPLAVIAVQGDQRPRRTRCLGIQEAQGALKGGVLLHSLTRLREPTQEFQRLDPPERPAG